MATATSKTTIILILSKAEARYLRNKMQNPPKGESNANATYRQAIWEALQGTSDIGALNEEK